MKRPGFCKGCPLEDGPGGFVPPTCTCEACSGKGLDHALSVLVGGVECSAPILAIGMAPGEEEERRGQVLVGPSGRVFHASLTVAGHTGPVRKLNLVQCRTCIPAKSKAFKNRDPHKKEVDFCRKHFLDRELEAFDKRGGKVVLLLGSLVYSHVAGDSQGSFAQARGHRFMMVVGPSSVVASTPF